MPVPIPVRLHGYEKINQGRQRGGERNVKRPKQNTKENSRNKNYQLLVLHITEPKEITYSVCRWVGEGRRQNLYKDTKHAHINHGESAPSTTRDPFTISVLNPTGEYPHLPQPGPSPNSPLYIFTASECGQQQCWGISIKQPIPSSRWG